MLSSVWGLGVRTYAIDLNRRDSDRHDYLGSVIHIHGSTVDLIQC